jgi:hypothetical protein
MVLVVIQVNSFFSFFLLIMIIFWFVALKIFKNGEVAEDYNGPREAGKNKKNDK